MLKIKYKNFPEYLKNSDFYKNLDSEDYIYVPLKNYKENDIINSLEDFVKIFDTINFFGMECTSSMKEYFIKNTEEIFDYYYPNIEEINIDHLFAFLFDESYNKYLINKIKIKIDEILDILRKKEVTKNKDFKYYLFHGDIHFKCKLKKKYVKIILGILEILRTQDFLKLKTYLNKDIKNFENFFSDVEITKMENLGYFLKLEKINSTLKITENRCFTEKLNKDVIEIITYKRGTTNFGSDFHIGSSTERHLKQKSGFLITFDEFYEVPKKLKNLFWLCVSDSEMPILNIYFNSLSSIKKYIKKNHKNIVKYFGENYSYKTAQSINEGDYKRFHYGYYYDP